MPGRELIVGGGRMKARARRAPNRRVLCWRWSRSCYCRTAPADGDPAVTATNRSDPRPVWPPRGCAAMASSFPRANWTPRSWSYLPAAPALWSPVGACTTSGEMPMQSTSGVSGCASGDGAPQSEEALRLPTRGQSVDRLRSAPDPGRVVEPDDTAGTL